MKQQFLYNVPASNTITGEPGMFLPIIAHRKCGATYWDMGEVESWKLVNIKSWAVLNAEVEQLANQKFANELIATA